MGEGKAISAAWAEPRITADDAMPLGTAYPRDQADAVKALCFNSMEAYLRV